MTVNINSNPTISIGGTSPICAGQSSNLSFTLTGTAPYYVNYLDGGNPANVTLDAVGTINGTPLSVTPNNTTTYTLVDVTDANNCTATTNGNTTIVVNPLPTVSISGSTSICDGESTALNFNFTGTGAYNINYDVNSVNTSAVLNNNVDSIVVSPSATTTYTLIDVTDAFCSNTANGDAIITILELPTAIISAGGDSICEGESVPIAFTLQNGLSPYNVNYTINGVVTTTSFNISGVNTLILSPSTTTVYSLLDITDANNCFNTANDSITINVNEKVDAIMSGGGEMCNDGSQATIDIITNDSTFVDITYTNGFIPTTLSGYSPFEIITNQAGFYMITDVVDIYGCTGTHSGNATITINPLPLAEFSFYPQPTDLDNPHINFINASFEHTSANWDFGDGSTLSDTVSKLLHTYQDTGYYKVTLAVDNEFGCTDTISYTIIIDPVFIIYIPNAFTPNENGINDNFGPSVYGIKKFEMKIYDRWGGIIYITDDEHKPWDGTINNNEVQAGVYSYCIVATDLKEKPHKFVGTFTLFK